jgi:hypothetical protein
VNDSSDQLGFSQRVRPIDERQETVCVFLWYCAENGPIVRMSNDETQRLLEFRQLDLINAESLRVSLDDMFHMFHLRVGHTCRVEN